MPFHLPLQIHQQWQKSQLRHSSTLWKTHRNFPTDLGIFFHLSSVASASITTVMGTLYKMFASLPVPPTSLKSGVVFYLHLYFLHCYWQVLGMQLIWAECWMMNAWRKWQNCDNIWVAPGCAQVWGGLSKQRLEVEWKLHILTFIGLWSSTYKREGYGEFLLNCRYVQ